MEDSRSLHKTRFEEKLSAFNLKQNAFRLSKEKIDSLIVEVKMAKNSEKKINRHYWLLKHHDVLTVEGDDYLIYPLTKENPKARYYCPTETVFDELYEIHTSIGHGGRDRMCDEVKKK